MHELGIVFSVADKVLEIARDNDLTEIVAITMQIGEISSVIPDYLKKCFPAAVEETENLYLYAFEQGLKGI